MAELTEILEASWQLIVAVVAILLALYGYIYNAQQQRALERNRMQFEVKVRAFKGLIKGARAAMNAYESLHGLAARMEDRDPIEALVVASTIARDLETPLGTNTANDIYSFMVNLHNRRAPQKESTAGPQPEDAHSEDVIAAALNLSLLYGRIFAFHHERLSEAYETAIVVMEDSEEFAKTVNEFSKYLWPAFTKQKERIENLLMSLPKPRTQPQAATREGEDYKGDPTLITLWAGILDAMNEDLFNTL